MKTYNCLACGKENEFRHSKVNKYCNVTCQNKYTWENVTKPRIEAGHCTHNSAIVLKRYLAEKYGEQCSECGIGNTWNDKTLVLHLDHIDGNSDNNFPENLRLLCPNCHSQTENYGSKGKGSRYKKVTKRNQYLQEYKGSCVER